MSSPPAQPICLTASEEALVTRQYEALGLESALPLGKLTDGRSGSLVVRLRLDDEEVVLKVTTDPARLTRARREAVLIANASHGLERVVPDLVACTLNDTSVSLVTRQHHPLPPPTGLDHAEWRDLARGLGAMHGAAEAMLPDDLPTSSAPDEQAIAEAARAWRDLGEEELADQGLSRLRDDLGRALCAPVRTTLEHGDCHTENIVRDDHGTFRWIDWQEAHLGTGLGDLIFLWQRAEFAGATPPRPATTHAYAEARALDARDLQPALDTIELRMLFVLWRPFLPYGQPDNQHMMSSRLRHLLSTRPSRNNSLPTDFSLRRYRSHPQSNQHGAADPVDVGAEAR